MTDTGRGRVKTLGLMIADGAGWLSCAVDWRQLLLPQSDIACKNGPTPRIAITRFML
jgi:hypothetical protein